jgi:hypothetical protein
MNNFKEEQNLIVHLTEYVQKFFLATKQEVKIDALNLAGTLITSVFILCVSLVFLLVLSICIGLLLESLLNSYILSFGILSGIYGTGLLTVYIYRKKLKAKIIQAIIKQTEQ